MDTSSCVVSLLLLMILFCPSNISCATPDINRTKDFIDCLIHNSLSSSPISNAIYTPKNSSFSSIFETYVRNLRALFPKPLISPLVIVTATHRSHVQATVVCSRDHDLMIRTRSGGHDNEGLSFVSHDALPFILLDMFSLRNWSIDMASKTMYVEAGATLGEVYYNIANYSKTHAFPAGLCPTVGVGGHFSGGGFGTLARKYGLATDNIVDAEIVDVNGRILDRKAMGEDLFWAIKGGGGASFGVILSWTIKLVNVPETVTVIKVKRIIKQDETELVERWQAVAATNISNDIFIRLELRADQQKKTITATFIGLFLGNITKLLSLMNESFPELGLQREDCTEMSWIESTLYFYGYSKGTPLEVLLNRVERGKVFAKSKSDFVKTAISKQGLKVIWQEMFEIGKKMMQSNPYGGSMREIPSALVMMQWNPYGGRMSEIPSTETPTPHRDGYLFKIQYLVIWKDMNKTGYYMDLSRQLFGAMTPYVTKSPREAFLNYRDLDIGTSPHANATYEEAKLYGIKYFNKNFERLVKVKTKADPGNFFRNEQSIPVLPKNHFF